jgi:hypothetical protein
MIVSINKCCRDSLVGTKFKLPAGGLKNRGSIPRRSATCHSMVSSDCFPESKAEKAKTDDHVENGGTVLTLPHAPSEHEV